MEPKEYDIVVTSTKELDPSALREIQALLTALDLNFQMKGTIIVPRPPRT